MKLHLVAWQSVSQKMKSDMVSYGKECVSWKGRMRTGTHLLLNQIFGMKL
jgi:hypothetical protein